MTPIRWIIFAVVCIGILAGLVFATREEEVDVSNVEPNGIINEGPIADHVYGNPEAEVVLIEYGDFQCPGCKALYPNVKMIKEDYKEDLAFVFRNYPLTSIHPNALAAATAAEAAGLQDKFYEMHDLLYENQDAWSRASAEERTEIFVAYAEQINLDAEKFRTDLSSEDIRTKIDRDTSLAREQGATGTPALYLNGEEIGSEIWQNEEVFRGLIEQEIARADQTAPETE